MDLHPLVKPDICDGDSEPSHQARNGSHVGKPTKDLARSSSDTHVREKGEQGTKYEGRVG
jgi:hypothetical protein